MPQAKVLTVSDGVAAGTRDDRSGRALVSRLQEGGYDVVDHRVTADGAESVTDALHTLTDGFSGLVVTTGGTGFGPRDLTPEGTRAAIEREAPGFAEVMRRVSDHGGRTFGMLARGVCGTIGQAMVCNLPGSSTGAVECLEAILPGLPHALELLAGEHPH